MLLAAAGVAVGGVAWEIYDDDLPAHGTRAQAQVVQVDDGQYLLNVANADQVWTGDVHGKPKVGDTLTVIYDRSDPSAVHDTRNILAWWVPPLLLGPLCALLTWLGILALRR